MGNIIIYMYSQQFNKDSQREFTPSWFETSTVGTQTFVTLNNQFFYISFHIEKKKWLLIFLRNYYITMKKILHIYIYIYYLLLLKWNYTNNNRRTQRKTRKKWICYRYVVYFVKSVFFYKKKLKRLILQKKIA